MLRATAPPRLSRQLIAADLVETLYRGLADNSVGRVIDTLTGHCPDPAGLRRVGHRWARTTRLHFAEFTDRSHSVTSWSPSVV